jgi:hypothetical protein
MKEKLIKDDEFGRAVHKCHERDVIKKIRSFMIPFMLGFLLCFILNRLGL